MPAVDLIRVGALGIEPGTSRMVGWLRTMNPDPGSVLQTRLRVTHVWDKDPQVARQYGQEFGAEVVERYDQMAGKVDVVLQTGHKAGYWTYELTKPYLEAGAVVFIDRPGAYSLTRAKQMLDLAEKHGAIVYWGNMHESAPPLLELGDRIALLEPLSGVVADALSDQETRFFALHGPHGLYMLHALLPGKVERVRTFLADESVFSPINILECRNSDGSPFVATLLRQGSDRIRHDNMKPLKVPRDTPPHRGWVKVFGQNGESSVTLGGPLTYSHENTPRPARAAGFTPPSEFSLAPLRNVEEMFLKRRTPQPKEQMLDKLRLFLAAWKSLIEDGAPVELANLPDDWTGPKSYPDYLSPDMFS